ncbi:MAG: hypothetical protein V7782_09875 [Psychromonas sp.]
MDNEVLLRLGENLIPEAPKVQLSNGTFCIPQHYLSYEHTLESVEALICDIEYDPRYFVFAAQEDGGIYIQVGVLGHDNYQKHAALGDLKLLFGRKWRVEPELPTSEIIQSVFLALKKSREHEVRELFKLFLSDSITTPFNTHIDLPLMAEQYQKQQYKNTTPVHIEAKQQVTNVLSEICYDNSRLALNIIERRNNGLWLLDIEVQHTKSSTLPETQNQTLYLQVENLSLNTISRALMQELVYLSDSHVDKHFSYRGFHRFDPTIDIADIADLSQQTRKHELAEQFSSQFIKNNQEVDQKRIPPVQPGMLAEKHQSIIRQFQLIANY